MFLHRRLFRFPPPTTRRLFSLTPQRSVVYIRFGSSQGPEDPLNQSPKSPNNDTRWDPKVKRAALVVGGLGLAFYVTHLEQVVDTGRWRFMFMSPEREAQFGEVTRRDIRKEFAKQILPPNHTLSVHVRRVVARILEANNLGVLRDGDDTPHRPLPVLSPAHADQVDAAEDNWNPDAHHVGTSAGHGGGEMGTAPTYGPQRAWDVIVVNDRRIINALASPGIIVVFTGLLPVCHDEEGLAAVLSHEIGHVVARHTAERWSSGIVAWGFIILFNAFITDVFGLSSLLHTFLFELPNSRKHELEADTIGLRLMSRACYDPAASASVMERLAHLEGETGAKGREFLYTHPDSGRRAKLLKEQLDQGYAIMASNPGCDQLRQQLEDFRATVHPVRFA